MDKTKAGTELWDTLQNKDVIDHNDNTELHDIQAHRTLEHGDQGNERGEGKSLVNERRLLHMLLK